MNHLKTPSSAEFLGMYNVPVKSPYRYHVKNHLNILRNPPPLILSEVKQVSHAVYQVIFKYANQRWFTHEEVRQYYDLCISEQLTDRTINVSFVKVDDCTLELIIQLQRLLASHHRLWRIRIGGSSHESTIMIYPNVVRFGSLPVNISPSTSFSHILHLEVEQRNKFGYKIEEDQIQIIRTILPSIISKESQNKIELVTRFDNYKGDFTKVTLWTMCKSDVVANLEMLAPDDSMTAGFFRVKSDGDFGRHVTEPAPFWIREWIFPDCQIPQRLRFKAYDGEYNSSTLDVDLLY